MNSCCSQLRRTVAGLAAVLLAVSAGCFNIGSPSESDLGSPGRGDIRLESVEWGRLVDVADASGVVAERNILIRQDVQPDGVNYNLAINPVTEEETLTILKDRDTEPAAFESLLTAAQAGLPSVVTKGPADAPPYPYLPRNAALRLTFTEMVNPATVNSTTIQVWSGNPPTQALAVRYVVQNDTRRGKGVVLLDPTVSARQSSQLGLPQNAVGFPASFDAVNDNLMVRIPTEVNVTFGQPQVLRNLSDTRSFKPGASDPTVRNLAGDLVVVRSLRTGNGEDLNNGFLQDAVRPSLVAVADVTVAQVAATADEGVVDLTYSVDAVNCKELAPKVGDTFEIGIAVAVVSSVLNSSNTAALQVRATVVDGELIATSSSQSGRLTTRYTGQDALRQACYLQFTPEPTVSVGSAMRLTPASSVTVRFDEAVDPTTLLSMHSMAVAAFEGAATDNTASYQKNGPETVGAYIDRQRGFHFPRPGQGTPEFGGRVLFGPIEVGNGGRDYTLIPMAGFTDPDGVGTDQFYALALRDGPNGVRDLSGNPLSFTGFVAGTPLAGVKPELTFRTTGAPRDKYLSLRGLGIDEDGDGLAEYGGQFNTQVGRITGRPPASMSLAADSNNDFIGRGLNLPQPGAPAPYDPLNPAGAVVMTLLRPDMFGLSYFNKLDYNLTVTGLSWVPLGGVVNDDTFDRFRIELSHSAQVPDEVINLAGLPVYPGSGLFFGEEFNANILGFDEGLDEKVVIDGEYTLRAINLFQGSTGTTMLPYPEFSDSYVWRDTAIPQAITGATGGIGAPPALVPGAGFWPTDTAPSVALPLLMHLSTFPRGNFLGTNQFQVTNMVPSALAQGVFTPAFTVFSSGGEDAGGRYNPVIPDNSAFGGTRPTGGFLNGQPTLQYSQNVYQTEATFGIQVSRVHTHWFDLGTTLTAPGDAIGSLLEPDTVNQNAGTQVVVEFRGSAAVSEDTGVADPSPLRDADIPFDDYGDFVNPGNASSVSTPGAFTSDLRRLEGQPQPYRFVQFRFSFISNLADNLPGVLDGFGLAWDF